MSVKDKYGGDELSYQPPREGIHTSLYAFACQVAEAGISEERTRKLIDEGLNHCPPHRDPTDREIECAINDGFRRVLEGDSPEEVQRERYCKDEARDIFEDLSLQEEDLIESSPASIPTTTSEAISGLFDSGELVNLAVSARLSKTKYLDEWLAMDDLSKYQLMVPHPMTALHGVTKDGRKHRPRTISNTGLRRWVITEFDKPPIEWQPSLILELAEIADQKPAMILWSGNKSLHAWWEIADADAEAIEGFESEASRLGADPAILGDARRCQLVRTPMAIRDNDKVQRILYWNPPTGKGGLS
jgi:hypothetical protein